MDTHFGIRNSAIDPFTPAKLRIPRAIRVVNIFCLKRQGAGIESKQSERAATKLRRIWRKACPNNYENKNIQKDIWPFSTLDCNVSG
jgi:hypothetical protein